MDLNELDKQLAELQLIANGELKNSMGANKKIGPAVPPKPKKQQPLVSLLLKTKKPCMHNPDILRYHNHIL